MDCHFLLQGIFPTQESNPGSPALQADVLLSEPWRVGATLCCGPEASQGASLVVEHRLWSTGSVVVVHRAELLRGIWDLPGPGIEPVSPAWQADFYPLDHQGSPLNFKKFQTYREVARIQPDFSTVNSFFSLYIYTYSFC